MKDNYDSLLDFYAKIVDILKLDNREVSEEIIQIIYDDIDDIMIEQKEVCQFDPNNNL